MTLYVREADGAYACENHARFRPLTEDEEADWRATILADLGPDRARIACRSLRSYAGTSSRHPASRPVL